jgi:hypothetical protein
MSNTYIKCRSSHSGIRKTPDSIGRKLATLILPEIVPVANPDFDEKIDLVVCWLIEFENDSYYPSREIGLDEKEQPIMIMPWRKNYGYWTDNNLVLEDFFAHFETVYIPGDYSKISGQNLRQPTDPLIATSFDYIR